MSPKNDKNLFNSILFGDTMSTGHLEGVSDNRYDYKPDQGGNEETVRFGGEILAGKRHPVFHDRQRVE